MTPLPLGKRDSPTPSPLPAPTAAPGPQAGPAPHPRPGHPWWPPGAPAGQSRCWPWRQGHLGGGEAGRLSGQRRAEGRAEGSQWNGPGWQGRAAGCGRTTAPGLRLLLTPPSVQRLPRPFVSQGLVSRRHSPTLPPAMPSLPALARSLGPLTFLAHCFLPDQHEIQGCLSHDPSHCARRPQHRLGRSQLYTGSRPWHLCLQPRLWSPNIPAKSAQPASAAPFLRPPHPRSLQQAAWGHPELLPFPSTFPPPPHLAQALRSHTQTPDFTPLPQNLPKQIRPLNEPTPALWATGPSDSTHAAFWPHFPQVPAR